MTDSRRRFLKLAGAAALLPPRLISPRRKAAIPTAR